MLLNGYICLEVISYYAYTWPLWCYRLQGTSVCQVTLIGIMVILLYTSRACYNLVVLALTDIENINSFDYDWYNVSDQVSITHFFSTHIQDCVLTQKDIILFPFLSLSCLWSCRQTWGPIWVMLDMWCLGWFSSSGNFCPPPWWSSSSGFGNQHKTGWGLKRQREQLSVILAQFEGTFQLRCTWSAMTCL